MSEPAWRPLRRTGGSWRPLRSLVVLASLLLWVLRPAAAQIGAITRTDEARALVAALRRQRDSLERVISVRDSALDRATARALIQAGALAVEVPNGDSAALRPAVEMARQSLERRFGVAYLASNPIRLRIARDSGLGPSQFSVLRLDSPRPGTPFTTRRAITFEGRDSLAVVSAGIHASASEVLWARLDAATIQWLPAPLDDIESAGLRARVFVALVTSPWALGQSCYRGTLRDCARAMGLIQPVDYLGWFPPEERRRLVEGVGYYPRDNARYVACTQGRVTMACDTILGSVQPLSVSLPLDGLEGRSLLFRLALDAGGQGAMARYLAIPDAPTLERLAQASGLPADSLLARWHHTVLAGRPEPVAVHPREAIAAFAWTLVLAGLALRSTRWR